MFDNKTAGDDLAASPIHDNFDTLRYSRRKSTRTLNVGGIVTETDNGRFRWGGKVLAGGNRN